MSKIDVGTAVIGGGVVGLSCAYSIAQRGGSVILMESHERLGEETSTHNSGVIHAGIYYQKDSLKARLCVAGRKALTQRLKDWKIPHRIGGKLIVASDTSEIPALENLLQAGHGNGVSDLRLIDRGAMRKIEPNIAGVAALHSPSTGVMDTGEYIRVLEARAIEMDAIISANSHVAGIDIESDSIVLHTVERGDIRVRTLVNAAGLWSDVVANLCGFSEHVIHPCRGEYATVIARKAHLVHNLVYPVPAQYSLGVHLTKTVDGELWLGPTAKFIVDKRDYESNRRPPEEFFEEARRLCPTLRVEDLRMGPSGVRPKRVGPDQPAADFLITRQPGNRRIIHLIGIESPGLTASPAIGELVCDLIAEGI